MHNKLLTIALVPLLDTEKQRCSITKPIVSRFQAIAMKQYIHAGKASYCDEPN